MKNNGWRQVPLCEVLELNESGTWGVEGDREDYPVLRSSNMHDGRMSLEDTAYRKVPERDVIRYKLEEHDILVTKSSGSSHLIGKSCLFRNPDGRTYLFSNFTQRLRTKKDFLDPTFLHLFLQSPIAKDFLKKISNTTSGLRNLSMKDYGRQLVPLPPLRAQMQIAAILEKADAVREKRRHTNQLTEQFVQSAFLEMFGDPVRNPKGFSIQAMENVCDKVTDGEHLTPKLKPSGKHIIMAKDVREDRIDFSQDHFVTEEEFTKFSRRCNPEKGDVLLVSRGATIGRCTVVRVSNSFCLMGSVILIKPRDVGPQYLEHLFKNSKFVKHLIKLSPASAQQAIYLQNLKKLRIPVPPKELQNKFADLVEKVESLRAKQRESEKELDNLFNSLMQRAFRGDLVG